MGGQWSLERVDGWWKVILVLSQVPMATQPQQPRDGILSVGNKEKGTVILECFSPFPS